MSQSVAALSVSIKELPAVHAACAEFQFGAGQDDVDTAIRERFQRVQAWVRERGYDPLSQLTIGVLTLVDGRPTSYGCCIQVPAEVQRDMGEISIQDLPGVCAAAPYRSGRRAAHL